MKPHPASFALLALVASAALAGCISRGPASISQQRGPYTEVLAQTDQEELLTNIVRLAYCEAPVFFQVASVTSSPSLEYGTESEIRPGGTTPPAILKPKILVKDSPTIVYKPLLGREFSNELLMPFDIRPVFLMFDNGFDFSIVAQLVFKSLNGLSNARNATPEQRAEFRRVTDAIARLAHSGALRIGTPPEGLLPSGGHAVVTIDPGARDTADARTVIEGLGLDPTHPAYELRAGLHRTTGDIAISARSLLALLSYLSNYVQPPSGHETMVWPSAARDEPDPLLRIHTTPKRPTGAAPAIFYNGHWFYIAADDLRSRNTLYLLRLLFNLQAQVANTGDTVQLTLPVR
jgi:hypothetical protein